MEDFNSLLYPTILEPTITKIFHKFVIPIMGFSILQNANHQQILVSCISMVHRSEDGLNVSIVILPLVPSYCTVVAI